MNNDYSSSSLFDHKNKLATKFKITKPLVDKTKLASSLNNSITFDLLNSEKLASNKVLKVRQIVESPFDDKTINSVSKIQKESIFSLAKKFEDLFIFKVFEDVLHVWDEVRGYYIPLTNESADLFFRKGAPNQMKPYINSRNIKEIVSWIKAECSIQLQEIDLIDNRNLIAFSNGIFNLKNNKLYELSANFNIRSTLNANYKPNINHSIYFEQFMRDICDADNELYQRIQEFFGYVISEIRDIKVICFLIGPKDSGKSIILKLLEHLIGNDFCTNLSLDELNQKEYLNRLLSKKLNTCGEVSEISIKRLDSLKKLSGGDKIMSKALYDQPISFINRSALVFAGNHLPEIKNIDKSNAFSDRLLIIPFENQIPKEKQDPTLFNKLINEIDYIANWALEGLIRLIINNYRFTDSLKNVRALQNYKIQSNTIEQFITTRCKFSISSKIFKSDLENAYFSFCEEHNVLASSNNEFHRYLKTLPNVIYKRFRLDDDNKNGYLGIDLRDEQ